MAYVLKFMYNMPYNFIKLQSDGVSLPSSQIQYIINHPFEYFKTFLNSIYHGRSYYITSTLGIFGLIDTYLPGSIYIVTLIVLFVCVLSNLSLDKKVIKGKNKILLLLVSLLSVGLGAKSITGVQGRYFLPLLFPFALVLSNSIFTKNKRIKEFMMKINNNSLLFTLILLNISIIMVILRFY